MLAADQGVGDQATTRAEGLFELRRARRAGRDYLGGVWAAHGVSGAGAAQRGQVRTA
jgi:hypothetical protein